MHGGGLVESSCEAALSRVITGSTRGRDNVTYTAETNRMVEPFRLSEQPALHAHRVCPRTVSGTGAHPARVARAGEIPG
jgi:hypothetical protein